MVAVKNEHGIQVTEDNEIRRVFVDYFKKLYKSILVSDEGVMRATQYLSEFELQEEEKTLDQAHLGLVAPPMIRVSNAPLFVYYCYEISIKEAP
jgi:hypothetical protein